MCLTVNLYRPGRMYGKNQKGSGMFQVPGSPLMETLYAGSYTPAAHSGTLFNLCVEEENLGSIPFAVLEQRVGKRVASIEVRGSKTLPDGTEVQVIWQVQGNSELGLPTEQDLDIFVALGVLTFRNQFAKTVHFQGREIARILNIAGVHGKFYNRLKLAMDRFIALRFRAIMQTDQSEDVKWLNVFQEASFSLDRKTGRCLGSITWTDKIIQSMDSGFFRLVDAKRYMMLDGLTTKYLYRYLAVAFERFDVVLIDARKLSTEHLGIIKPPKYFSRLLQTLEPTLEQLQREEVVGSWHIVSEKEWRMAIRRHPNYRPERQLLESGVAGMDDESRFQSSVQGLQAAGLPAELAAAMGKRAGSSPEGVQMLERAAHLLVRVVAEGVMLHAAQQILEKSFDAATSIDDCRETLDWLEIGLCYCEQKKGTAQALRNGAGLIVKLARDPQSRQRMSGGEFVRGLRTSFRRREAAAMRQHEDMVERELLGEYEQFAEREARRLLAEMPDEVRRQLHQEKISQMAPQERFQKLGKQLQQEEAESAVLTQVRRHQVAPFEKWRLRRLARQASLPFSPVSANELAAAV